MNNIIIIHYAEIALKGENRREFEKKLVENIRLSLGDLKYQNLKRISGRILVTLESNAEIGKFQDVLNHVFGIAHFSFGVEVEADLEEIEKTLLELLKNELSRKFPDVLVSPSNQDILRQPFDKAPFDFAHGLSENRRQGDIAYNNKHKVTFRITSRRGDKNFPLTSEEINRKVGEYIFEKSGLGLKVNLKNPDINCIIEIAEGRAFMYFEKIKGIGGLPVGVSGKVLSLISSGFDSPVAAWHLMKRGARVDFIHFHSYPRTSKASINNVKSLVEILNKYQFESSLYLVPLLDIQREIFSNCEGKYRILLYRRFMMRIAERIANQISAGALVTGESLGQVASQTLENIRVTNAAVSIPIFRPFIGTDKIEIIDEAKKIGTYEFSSQPYEDCCSLFTPLHPATKARLQDIEFEESKLDVEKLIKEAIGKMEKAEFK